MSDYNIEPMKSIFVGEEARRIASTMLPIRAREMIELRDY